jgi:hypothetical protein
MGKIAVGNRVFTVNQSGDTRQPVCDYSVTPIEFSPCMSSSIILTAAITTQQGCTWTASPGASWITVTGGQSGSGSGNISFSVSDNWDAPRRGVVMVRWPTETAGQNLQVAQAGCYYAVSTSAISIPYIGGTGQFNVVQTSDPITCGSATQDRCRWTAESDVPWIQITTTMPQAGDNPVSFSVQPNAGTAPRTGRITVRDKVVQITQNELRQHPANCGYSVTPIEFHPCMSGSALNATITTQPGCTWTASSDVPWITVTHGQGSGPGNIPFYAADNWDAVRLGVIIVSWPTQTAGPQILPVMQAGCYYAVSTSAISIGAAGGSGQFDVVETSDPISCGSCRWTAQSDVPWITITTTMPQTGDNPVSFSVAANSGAAARTGRITVGGKVVQITQSGQ